MAIALRTAGTWRALVLLICSMRLAAADHCNAESFACDDGACILAAKMCDGRPDCADGSDETACEMRLCRPPHWFKCASSPSRACLATAFVCNGHVNCPAGEDEDEKQCQRNVTAPSSLSPLWRFLLNETCSEFEFACSDSQSCIPLDFMCDGKKDCQDGSDEQVGCARAALNCDGYFCPTKKCLESPRWLCDGVDDCGDNSDEQHCTHNCTLEHEKFLCGDNSTCIELHEVCNERPDCPDGSDELHCSDNCTCPATAKCVFQATNYGPTCICPKGYRHALNGSVCADIDECAETYGICSQHCENTAGGYKCSCADGYALAEDKRTCRVDTGGVEPLLLYSTQFSVNAVHLRTRRLELLAHDLRKVIGVDSDGAHIYWTSIADGSEAIVRANMNGSAPETVIHVGLDAPEDLAVDWLTGNIYFTDNLMSHIAVCANDGLACLILIANDVDMPRGIAVYPERGQLYWTDWGARPMIMRSSMDGKRQTVLARENVHWPNGISLDTPNERLYWVDAKHGVIESMRLDGSDRRLVIDGILKHPFGLAVFEDSVYWSDWGTKSLHVCNKFTGKDHAVLVRDRTPYAVHIYHPAKQPKRRHACLTSHCSHLCLLTEHGGHRCACPEGYELNVDGRSCLMQHARQTLFIGVGSRLLTMQPVFFGRHELASTQPLSLHIDAMVYNSINGTLIIADNRQQAIFEYEPHSETVLTLLTLRSANVTALGFDYLTHNVYIADAARHVLEILSLQTRQRAIINYFSGADKPIGLAVWPEERYVYIAVSSTSGRLHIDKQLLSGDDAQAVHLFEDELGKGAIHFALDMLAQKLFWTNSDAGLISYTDYHDAPPSVFRSGLQQPRALAIVNQQLFWTQSGSTSLYCTHMSNFSQVERMEIDVARDATLTDTHITLTGSLHSRYHDHVCLHANGGCSHVCATQSMSEGKCLCPPGYTFRDALNKTCIESLDCEYRCKTGECLTLSRRCNGRRDCADGSDELGCDNAKPSMLTCSLLEFTCHDRRQCVRKEMVCNGRQDCRDGSDEQQCASFDKSHGCSKHEFACLNGRCVDLTITCDRRDDCGDNSDEIGCGEAGVMTPCTKNMFRCASGSCIPSSWECDSKIDCVDGSDEHDKCAPTQPQNCSALNMFRCATLGSCIDQRLVCNGDDNCGDNSDERHCDRGERMATMKATDCIGKFACISKPGLCINYAAKCNGSVECPGGEDEHNCPAPEDANCAVNEFKCLKGIKCIRHEFRCDGDRDCADGSDELNCGNVERACRPGLYDCGDDAGKCVSWAHVCNGVADCHNGRDEGPGCATACDDAVNDGQACSQKCLRTPDGSLCGCFSGYTLNADRRTCDDIDECAEKAPCAQDCENTPGSYRCHCYEDFMLRQDRHTCKAIDGGGALLYSRHDELRRRPTDDLSNELVILRTNGSTIQSFDLDTRRRSFYYTIVNEDLLYFAHIDSGSTRRVLDVPGPSSLAVDWLTSNVYVLSHRNSAHEILVCTFASRRCASIHRETPTTANITALVVDAYNRRLFYALHNRLHNWSRIVRARLDATQHMILLHSRLIGYISALAIDPHKQVLYYINTHAQTLEAISYAANVPVEGRIILRNSYTKRQPAGLCVHENHIIYIVAGPSDAGVLASCQLFGSHQCTASESSSVLYDAGQLRADSIAEQPIKPNRCAGVQCAGVCVSNDDDIGGHVCLCGLDDDKPHNVQCIENAEASPNADGPSAWRFFLICLLMLLSALLFVAACLWCSMYLPTRWQVRSQQHPTQERNLNFNLAHTETAASDDGALSSAKRYIAELQRRIMQHRSANNAGTTFLLNEAADFPTERPPAEMLFERQHEHTGERVWIGEGFNRVHFQHDELVH